MTSAPIYLYEVTRDGTTWRYCGWGIDLSVNGFDWNAENVKIGAISSGGEILGDGLDIEFVTDDDDHPFRAYIDPFTKPATVTIYEVDASVLSYTDPVFIGDSTDVTFGEDGKISVQLSSILRIAERSGPRIQIQRTCNHDVYDQFCGLNAALFTTAGTITAVSSIPAYVEAVEFGNKATAESEPQWFALGKVICGTEIRFCVGQVGDRLYLNAPFRDAEVSDAISALAGCDKRINSGCTKLANTANFLGFPFLPNANPQFEALKTPEPAGGKK
jgi:hypothetical protein